MQVDEFRIRYDGAVTELLAYTHAECVGSIRWFKSGEIEDIFVEPTLRRQGIATALWNEAHNLGFVLRHTSARTENGDAWAHSIGGYLPELDDDVQYG